MGRYPQFPHSHVLLPAAPGPPNLRRTSWACSLIDVGMGKYRASEQPCNPGAGSDPGAQVEALSALQIWDAGASARALAIRARRKMRPFMLWRLLAMIGSDRAMLRWMERGVDQS